MPTDVDQLQKQLQRAWLRTTNSPTASKPRQQLKEPRKGFFTTVHILITAIIAFFIARHIWSESDESRAREPRVREATGLRIAARVALEELYRVIKKKSTRRKKETPPTRMSILLSEVDSRIS